MSVVIADLLLAAGVLLLLFAVLGVCVMRDPLDRLHAVGLASYGVLLIGGAVLVRNGFSLLGDKALLTGALSVALSPVLVHTTARTVRIRRHGDWRAPITDAEQGGEPR